MHIVIAILSILGAAYFWVHRIRNAGRAVGEIKDMADDVRLAARRFGFKRRVNVHPVETVDDPRLAAAGIIAAMAEMDAMATDDTLREMKIQAQSVFDVEATEAEEMVVFGRWIASQCGTKHEAVRRLSKKLLMLAGTSTLPDLEIMITRVCSKDGQVSEDVQEALNTIRRIIK